MKFLIHACPQRMWYVEEFLVPELRAQGAEEIEIWNDAEKAGNLISCMQSFRSRPEGDGATWHLQDDVLLCRDFLQRCSDHERGIVYGFCCEQFGDDSEALGLVHVPSGWHSFQCVRIPDALARECAEWYFSGRWMESPSAELPILDQLGKGDDTFFHEFLECRHGGELVYNVAPNLVEHVDWLLGGSTLHPWAAYLPRAEFFDDGDLVEKLRADIRARSSD